MMEFTYDGIVRQGFGFYNPNHAAALICSLLPFVWAAWFRWRDGRIRAAVMVANLLLLAALAATFSRTGLILFAGEMVLYAVLRKGAGWKVLLAVTVAAVVIAMMTGVWARFVFDASLGNRFRIWQAGAELFAANPLRGVGVGNSGYLASAFLLPDGVACRTLVNSHLTLMAELGGIAGWTWLCACAYALLQSRRHPAACASLAGLLVSAFMSSIFDWPALFNFKTFGGLGMTNFLMSWALLLWFIGLIVGLVFASPFNTRRMMWAAGMSALMVLALCCMPHSDAPHVQNEFAILRATTQDAALALHDEDWPLRKARRMLAETTVMFPLRPWSGNAPAIDAKTVFLFGDCASYASEYPHASITLISPPPYFQLPKNISALWIPLTDDTTALRKQAQERDIPIVVF